MAGSGSPLKAILYAFCANFGIAIAKTLAAVFTGSSSMLAEAIHSYADTGNQLLLLLGMHRSKRPADSDHPLGYGKVSYFWSFIVALILFTFGGLFSIYEGWHKLAHPQPLRLVWVAIVVVLISIVLESISLAGCLREIRKMRGSRTLWQWLHQSRNSELVVVYGEDLGALLGLGIALVFLILASLTGDARFDAYGSVGIGVVLLVISVFVAVRIKSLLIGRSADPQLVAVIEDHIESDDDVRDVYNLITFQMGPKVMLAAKIRLRDGLSVREACEKINALERRLRERFPDIGWSFVEPDVTD